MHTTLTPAQELVVIALRTTLLFAHRRLAGGGAWFVNPALSRGALGRCLRRHGVLQFA